MRDLRRGREWRVAVAVAAAPRGTVAVSNGLLTSVRRRRARSPSPSASRSRWRGRDAGLRRIFRSYYRTPSRNKAMWRVPPRNPGRKKIFAPAVYFSGAMALEALRELIGDAPFYEAPRSWE